MDHETRIKRLKYVSWYRGCKETDKILGGFAKTHLDSLSPTELDEFERIMEEDDKHLFHWISGQEPMPERYAKSQLMQRIINFDVASLYQ